MTKQTKLLLPALKGLMGDWTYYVAVMRLQDVAERIKPVAEIHKTETLSKLIQRQLQEGHSKAIKDYLVGQPQRLFNALVVGVYGGSPQWCEVSVSTSETAEISEGTTPTPGVLGYLSLEGTEELFAIDGQHRVVGIQKAIAEDAELSDEEVSVLFVAHSNDDTGLERTRRLFTVLNRHAKIVGKMELIALDDDDPIAITTRRLADEYPLFQDKISISKSKNLSVKDRSSVTSIISLYDSLEVYFKTAPSDWSKRKKKRPTDEELNDYYRRAALLWKTLQKHFSPLEEAASHSKSDSTVEKYRTADGGNLIFRPIGFQLLVQAVRVLVDSGLSLNEAAKRLAQIPWNLSSEPWSKLLWNPSLKRMITTKEHQKLALKLLIYGSGADLSLLKTDETKLRQELAEVYGVEMKAVKITRYAKER